MAAEKRLIPGRLDMHHFAHLRGVAQGMPVIEAAKCFLGIEHGNEALAAHRLVVDRVAAVARRRGDSRWRLLGLEIDPAAGQGSAPSLQEWAQAQGLEDWSQAELLDLYTERFGAPDPVHRRRLERNARLRTRRLALLRELEAAAAERAAPGDLLDGWVAPELAEQLGRRGLLTLGELQALIHQGGRWWTGLAAYGPTKAARLARHVEQLLGTRLDPIRFT